MDIQQEIPLLESIFEEWKSVIGEDYLGYRNHVYRMLHFCFLLKVCSKEEIQKLTIAAAFHDIGIWTDNTLDYIPPSIPPAMKYLEQNGLEAWSAEITLMISEHHKISSFKSDLYPLVELFRRADLVDFSLGLFRFGLSRKQIKSVNEVFPNAGFHRALLKHSAKWLPKHPLRPAPMFKL